MANYTCASRTNYFRVTDEDEYAKIFSHLCSEDGIQDFTKTDANGNTLHGFGCYASIDYKESDDDTNDDNYDFDLFIKKLQKILPENEAFLLFEAGNEKLRYVIGYVTIVTKTTSETLSLEEMALKRCKELLGADFNTETSY